MSVSENCEIIILNTSDFTGSDSRLKSTDFLTQIRACRGFNRRREHKDSPVAGGQSLTADDDRSRVLTPTRYEIRDVSRCKTAERGSSFEFHGWPPDDDCLSTKTSSPSIHKAIINVCGNRKKLHAIFSFAYKISAKNTQIYIRSNVRRESPRFV